MKFNLSEITEVIRNRRSISPEKFSSRKVHREQIELMLNNASWAPTHGMTQPWRFFVYMEEGRRKLSEFLPELYKKSTSEEQFKQVKYDRFKGRPLHVTASIVVAMERDKSEKIAEVEEIEAVACAVQNLLLTCTAYGISGFWSSPKMIYQDEMKDFLGLESQDRVLGILYIGYPEMEWPESHRRPIEYVTKWELTAEA